MERRILQMQNAQVRERDGKRYLEGYFAVFGKEYKVWDGWVETISNGAFARYLSSGADTKVLWNHNSNIVLGSTANGTAILREDEVGLWGSVLINEKDQDAVNAHARVERGDVTGCSFGFDIARQEEWWDDEGVYRTKILEVDPLYEVSPCTFPAYADTSINARDDHALADVKAQFESKRGEHLNNWRSRMMERLKGENHGT